MQFVGYGLAGVWFLLLGRMTSGSGSFSKPFSSWASVTGAGFAVGSLGSPLGPDNPIVMIGATISFIGFVMWSLLTRKEILAR